MNHHLQKSNLNGLWAQLGGTYERAFFELWIQGDSLDPDTITASLGVAPTKAYRKGDSTASGSQYRRTGIWLLCSGEVSMNEENPGYNRFLEWCRSLPKDGQTWRSISETHDVGVSLVLYSNRMNSEFVVTPEAMGELSQRGLALTIDGYFETDDD